MKDRPALRMIEAALARRPARPRADPRRLDERQHRRRLRLDLRRARAPLRARHAAPTSRAARKRIAQAFGAELVFSDPLEGSDGAIRQVRELVEAEPDRWFYPDQYGNAENPRAHEHGTAVEIAEALDGAVAAFVAGIGTSGTVMGTSRGPARGSRPASAASRSSPPSRSTGSRG